jgi:hypothetical protein
VLLIYTSLRLNLAAAEMMKLSLLFGLLQAMSLAYGLPIGIYITLLQLTHDMSLTETYLEPSQERDELSLKERCLVKPPVLPIWDKRNVDYWNGCEPWIQ